MMNKRDNMTNLSVRIQLSQPLPLLSMLAAQGAMIGFQLLELCSLVLDFALNLLLVLGEILHDRSQFLIRFCTVSILSAQFS